MSLSTESFSPQPHQGQNGHKIGATKPVIVLSVLAMVGLLVAVAALSAKLIKRYGNQPSGEKRPLLEDRLVHLIKVIINYGMVWYQMTGLMDKGDSH